jgi:hypothetical protein
VSYTPNPKGQTWSDCKERLRATMTTWGVREFSLDCPTSRYGTAFAAPGDRFVIVGFVHPETGRPTEVRIDKFERPVDNLWALALGLDAIRLNDKRGFGDVARQVYTALPAPRERDPFEVLGVLRDAPWHIVEGAYRAAAKEAHPDRGGTAERMAELNEAYERAKAVRDG